MVTKPAQIISKKTRTLTATAPDNPDSGGSKTITSQVNPGDGGGGGGNNDVGMKYCGLCRSGRTNRNGKGLGRQMKWFGKILNGLRRVLCCGGDGHSVVDEDRTTRNSIDIGQPGPGITDNSQWIYCVEASLSGITQMSLGCCILCCCSAAYNIIYKPKC
jgi:hypothetical protein